MQSLADAISITETWQSAQKPKVVLTWAPHVKALPQAVGNSFAEWMRAMPFDFSIACPPGYELAAEFAGDAPVLHHQDEAIRGADYIYVKNWSAYADYGKMPPVSGEWLLDNKKLEQTNRARVMHCLPVRRNVELSDEILDDPHHLFVRQAENRVYAALAVLKNLIQ